MKKYTTLMSAYGVSVGIDFKFQGMVANTLNAHRLIQHFQEEMGPETANKIVDSLYKQYFEEEAHPAAPATLLKAALDGGVELSEAEAFVGDEYEALPETRLLIREQASNGIEYVILVLLVHLATDFEALLLPKIVAYVQCKSLKHAMLTRETLIQCCTIYSLGGQEKRLHAPGRKGSG